MIKFLKKYFSRNGNSNKNGSSDKGGLYKLSKKIDDKIQEMDILIRELNKKSYKEIKQENLS